MEENLKNAVIMDTNNILDDEEGIENFNKYAAHMCLSYRYLAEADSLNSMIYYSHRVDNNDEVAFHRTTQELKSYSFTPHKAMLDSLGVLHHNNKTEDDSWIIEYMESLISECLTIGRIARVKNPRVNLSYYDECIAFYLVSHKLHYYAINIQTEKLKLAVDYYCSLNTDLKKWMLQHRTSNHCTKTIYVTVEKVFKSIDDMLLCEEEDNSTSYLFNPEDNL
jgi:hypothetical protein